MSLSAANARMDDSEDEEENGEGRMLFSQAVENSYDKQWADGSKSNYNSKIRTIGRFLNAAHSSQVVFTEDGIPLPKLPLAKYAILDLFGWLISSTELPKRGRGRKRKYTEEEELAFKLSILGNSGDAAVTNSADKITMKAGSVSAFRSALKWYYKINKMSFACYEDLLPENVENSTMEQEVSRIINGYKNIVGDKKNDGVMSVKEGKSEISFAGYEVLCMTALALTPTKNSDNSGVKNTFSEGLFAWAWLTLQWNLMGRSQNVDDIMLEHCDWKEDSLRITFAKHKKDRSGEGPSLDKHLFANTINPAVIPPLLHSKESYFIVLKWLQL